MSMSSGVKKVKLGKSKASRCHFRAAWLSVKDENGFLRSEWLKKSDDDHAFCSLCCCTIKFSSQGGQAITFHEKTTKHVENCRIKLAPNQLHLERRRPGIASQSTASGGPDAGTIGTCTAAPAPATIQIYSARRKSVKAEILWGLKCVASDFSAASNDGIKELFEEMFEDPACLENFSLSRTKFSYLLTDGLAPYFREKLKDDFSGQYYTLYYDETVNDGGSKELRIGARYWSEKEQKIVSAHLRTYFIQKATGENVAEKLLSAIDEFNLPLSKLIMLGSDGPYVNLKIWRLINEKVKECRGKPLLDVGTCNLHIVHNAFSNGLEEYGEDVSNLASDIYDCLMKWPSRWEDYEKIQSDLNLPSHRFIKHISSRWLTLEGAVDRVLEQWDAIKQYFVHFVPAERPQLAKKVAFLKIRRIMSSDMMRAQVIFVRNSAQSFTHFSRAFQKEEPLIHVLHSELRILALTLMNRICKPEAIKDKGVVATTLHADFLLPPEDVGIGIDVARELETSGVSQQNIHQFRENAQKHIVAACKHLIAKSALRKGSDARYYRCLQPGERTSVRSCKDILTVAQSLPVAVDVNRLLDEWKLLQEEKDAADSAEGPIDAYWKQFFTMKRPSGNELKYGNVSVVVKAALSISHGQADVERGFSASGRTLTSDRASMNERTLNAYMVVKNALRQHGNKPNLVLITDELITCAQGAHAKYKAYIEDMRLQKQRALEVEAERQRVAEEEAIKIASLDKTRKRILEQEHQLKTEVSDESKKRKTGLKLLEEGNARLKEALKSGNLEEVAMAQAIIEAAQTAEKEAQSKAKEVKAIQKEIEKKKSKLLFNFCDLPPKK